MNAPEHSSTSSAWREQLYRIIFEADTRAGKAFDVALLITILISVVATCLETVEPYGKRYQATFFRLEWTVTILFTIEYVLRIMCVRRPAGYIFSFFGVVDLLAILPSYIGLTGINYTSRLTVIRSLRLLRVFRVLNLSWFVSEASALRHAVWKSRAKIVVFLFTVIILVTLAGTIIYELEDGINTELDSIPDGIYWAIVTMTTVGYGDVVPVTTMGKVVSAILILFGYSLIIVPTGFVSAEFVQTSRKNATRPCPNCMAKNHAADAVFCRVCGSRIDS